ncbi:hypothetical protein BDV3_004011 [Batrachochytrium dendrobatidis]
MIMHIFAGLTELDHVENHLDFTSRFVFNSYLTFALSFHFYCYKIDQSVTAVLALLFLWLFCHFGFPVACSRLYHLPIGFNCCLLSFNLNTCFNSLNIGLESALILSAIIAPFFWT